MSGGDETPREDVRDKDVGDQMPEEQKEDAVVDDDPEQEPEMGGSPPP